MTPDAVLARIVAWASGRDDVLALLLAGSHARGEARAESDVDLLFLATDPQRLVDELAERSAVLADLGPCSPPRVERWGVLRAVRTVLANGLELELGVAPSSWAATAPVDAGTRRVIADGVRILYDPAGLLRSLATSVNDTGQVAMMRMT